MALGYGEGTGGGMTNASRSAGGGYGGVRGPTARNVGGGRLVNDEGLYAHKNHNLTPKPMTPAPLSGGGGGLDGGLGYTKQTENDMINSASDEISSGQEEAKRAAGERAAALGFSRSGGTEEAMQRIDSAAAGDKAGAARDVRIASANLGFQREQADADRNERTQVRADESMAARVAAGGMAHPNDSGGSGGGGGSNKGRGAKADVRIIGGGAGRAAPANPAGGGGAAGGRAAPAGGGPVQGSGSGNSRKTTF